MAIGSDLGDHPVRIASQVIDLVAQGLSVGADLVRPAEPHHDVIALTLPGSIAAGTGVTTGTSSATTIKLDGFCFQTADQSEINQRLSTRNTLVRAMNDSRFAVYDYTPT